MSALIRDHSCTTNVQSLEHHELIVERDGDTNGERLKKSEGRQEEKVSRVRVTLPVEYAKVDDSTEERDIERPSTNESSA
jgi:hypothetical protein